MRRRPFSYLKCPAVRSVEQSLFLASSLIRVQCCCRETAISVARPPFRNVSALDVCRQPPAAASPGLPPAAPIHCRPGSTASLSSSAIQLISLSIEQFLVGHDSLNANLCEIPQQPSRSSSADPEISNGAIRGIGREGEWEPPRSLGSRIHGDREPA
ncbi:unnamed protein product [Linum trigynum]|uniref:Uncharacterized protein n=1 Tax=Linum trigynum TaxID=586398 RepID=A0AAV2DC60_9ROSI